MSNKFDDKYFINQNNKDTVGGIMALLIIIFMSYVLYRMLTSGPEDYRPINKKQESCLDGSIWGNHGEIVIYNEIEYFKGSMTPVYNIDGSFKKCVIEKKGG